MMEWLAGLTAPVVYFALRRAPYLACYGYGMMLATQEGITIERQAAFDKGRTAILQNAANAAATAWRSADWALVWTGLLFWRHKIHEAAADTWRGVRRDATLVWTWMHGRLEPKEPPARTEVDQAITLLHEAKTVAESGTPMAEDAAVAAQGLLYDLEQRRWVLRADLKNPDTKSSLETVRQYDNISRTLAEHYDQNPADAAHMAMQRGLLSDADRPQSLFGPVAALAGGLSWKLTAASAGLAVLFFGLWRHDEGALGRVKAERDAANATVVNYKAGVSDRDKRITDLRAEVHGQNVQCVTETKEAADRRVAQANRRVAAEIKARGKINEASSGAARPFNLDERLRELSEPAGGPSASTGGSAPS